jgi:hypothetical protein
MIGWIFKIRQILWQKQLSYQNSLLVKLLSTAKRSTVVRLNTLGIGQELVKLLMKIQICLIDFIKGELIGTEENKAAEVSEYQFE